jgi:hypothetical protein
MKNPCHQKWQVFFLKNNGPSWQVFCQKAMAKGA